MLVVVSPVVFCPPGAFAGDTAVSPVDEFSGHALTEWIVLGETLPASPSTLGRMVTDLVASVRLAREVTGLDYVLTPVDTGEFELSTPRGLTCRVRPVRVELGVDTGLFEAVGYGEFRRAGGVFRGLYAMRFRYDRRSGLPAHGDFHVYLDVQNRFLRFVAYLARGILKNRLTEEMSKMLKEAKEVMLAAETRLSQGRGF